MSFSVGQMTGLITGDITQLNALILGSAERTAKNVGFHADRLKPGYWILLLMRLPQAHEFEFAGTTLRSAGRVGVPQKTKEQDKTRARVHDQINDERGSAGYAALQQMMLRDMQTNGPKRLVKVIPKVRHNDATMRPYKDYPMGGGFLQWNLKEPGIAFFCAAEVGQGGQIAIPGQAFSMETGNTSTDYAARARLQQYLQIA